MAGLEEKLAGLKAAHEAGGLDDDEYAEACAMVRSEAMEMVRRAVVSLCFRPHTIGWENARRVTSPSWCWLGGWERWV
jgi:hypothetical protein